LKHALEPALFSKNPPRFSQNPPRFGQNPPPFAISRAVSRGRPALFRAHAHYEADKEKQPTLPTLPTPEFGCFQVREVSGVWDKK
jgi:hypothetical protein